MSAEAPGWTALGRTADALAVAAALGGLVLLGFKAAGIDLLSDPDTQALTWTTVGFGAMGVATMVTAIVRVQRDGAGFAADRGSATRFLYRISAALLILAVTTGGIAVLRPAPEPPCVIVAGT
ncbi:hypothetical protein [Actinokineospora diospyrosa]|uniref:Uncharacterized protein n=1 Tax=Actinokineospora diospyrosa TaxID=103728 RepID=A0ABT1I5Z6_9PSEU|nr:hypothetical protein [Actinokineospora diospyrosa]MCP2268047.1 hypothetical protein [Actinokineospora diospyrosa]